MKNRLAFSFLILILIGFGSNKLDGQTKEIEESTSKFSIFKEVKRENTALIQDNFDFYLRKPVILYFENNDVLKGYLLPNVSENSDTIFVEINGEYKRIDFDSIKRLVMLDDPFDIIKGRIAINDLYARVDDLMIGLNNDPTSTGYIIYYYGKGITKSYINVRKKATTKHIEFRKFDENRIKQMDGPDCGNKGVIEMWVIPSGGAAPVAKCQR